VGVRPGQRTMRRRSALAAVLAASVAVAACGSGDHDAQTATATGGEGERAALMEGLVAPTGTRLVGDVFERPWGDEVTNVSTVAVLTVDGDPFAAWDDLAGQIRDLGAPFPGSGACAWLEQGDSGSTPVRSVAEPAPAGADGVTCAGSATAAGGAVSFLAELWVSPDGAELGVETLPAEPGSEAQSYPEVGTGAAPAGAADRLPPVEQPALPRVGEPFGRENNCFESGYERFTVPEGAEVVGGGNAPVLEDFAAVLAVDDAPAVLEALAGQLDPTGPSTGDAAIDVRQARVPGGQVWELTGSVSAGGGACGIWSSPDGKLLLVMTHSD
jgi:hypothetical protein